MKRLFCIIISSFIIFGVYNDALAEVMSSPNSNKQIVKSEKKKVEKSRFIKLFSDNSFNYYVDLKSAQWIQCPNTRDEYIIDVWIKMIPVDQESNSILKEDTMAAKYYLEHYYLRPSKQQIQFLCELEVAGRPNNNVKQREFQVGNWESLIPGSIEDEIYNSVLEVMKKHKHGSAKTGRDSGNNFLEETLRISI